MSFGLFLFILFAFCGVIAAVQISAESKLSSGEKKKLQRVREHGPLNNKMVCPHCQTKGHVHTRSTMEKKGVSGGKATGALLTGGVSLLATGLSRKEEVTSAFCRNCSSRWQF